MIMRKRMIDNLLSPLDTTTPEETTKPVSEIFLYQAIGDYSKQSFSTLTKPRVGDLAQIVLGLYGAISLGAGEPPQLGYLADSRTLVYADSPNKLTTRSTLTRAIDLRDSVQGGRDRVIVLGRNFSPSIIHDIDTLAQGDRLEVLVIPPDLLDHLKSKKHLKDLIESKKIRFSSLQYLTIKPVQVEKKQDTDALTISLDNYVLLSPDALPLHKKDRDHLNALVASEPLSLIEYRSIDPDYDGECFRSQRQDYRDNTDIDNDPLRCVTSATLHVPAID